MAAAIRDQIGKLVDMQARDRLGRPLRGEAVSSNSFPQVPERTYIFGERAWTEITDYLARDLPFHVHEVAEQRWRCAPLNEKDFWRACAQMGAALTHQARGNAIGAHRLSLRAQETLNAANSPPSEIDPVSLQTFFSTILVT